MAGVTGEIDRADAEVIAWMMVSARRILPPQKFVDWMIDRDEAAALGGVF